MSKFRDDIQKIMNAPVNVINRNVMELMSTENYITYTNTIFPVDRAIYIYEFNHRVLTGLFQTNRSEFYLDDSAFAKRNEILSNGMVYIHNYISSQFSLLDILKKHAEPLPWKNDLLAEWKKLHKMNLTKFFSDMRNNILHQTNFGPSLRFDSKWGHTKIVYPVAELLKSDRWNNSKGYISTLGDYVLLEDLVEEYHGYMMDFLHRYQAILYDRNAVAFKQVLTSLLDFAHQYKAIGQQGFLPASEEYIVAKLNFYPNS
ncbi:hypothetical protein [Chryseolinea lacunae]|uniref:Cthe-2314-like HEPN domain-containing protein n=1 Tax=Chryseolinea lacunae TaxID=2801331 RepID=A0ABS1KZL5_9BACT|nr:hypothetical protein [Chryseolinea lacunae]MBL0744829.1 hypothetical protein [Chryseolinea lacunae]